MSMEDKIREACEICGGRDASWLSADTVFILRQMISDGKLLDSTHGASGWLSLVNDLEKMGEADFDEEIEEVKKDLSWVLEDIGYICEYTRKARGMVNDCYYKLTCLNIPSDDVGVVQVCVFDSFYPFFSYSFKVGDHSANLALDLCQEDAKGLLKEIFSNCEGIEETLRQMSRFLDAMDKKPLPTVFGTLRERYYFRRAIDAGLMAVNDNPGDGLPAYTWRGTLVRLAYFADRVYYEAGRFPASALERLFGVRNLKQVRYRMNCGVEVEWMKDLNNILGLS